MIECQILLDRFVAFCILLTLLSALQADYVISAIKMLQFITEAVSEQFVFCFHYIGPHRKCMTCKLSIINYHFSSCTTLFLQNIITENVKSIFSLSEENNTSLIFGNKNQNCFKSVLNLSSFFIFI